MIGLVCEVRLRNFLFAPCSDMIAAGLLPLGRYAQIEEPRLDPRFLARRR
jgi:hypothetical protein